MAKTEMTQFSRVEFIAFRNNLLAGTGVLPELGPEELKHAMTAREQAMYTFAKNGDTEMPRIEKLGGFFNIQRVRVLREDAGAMSFEYSLVKPVGMVVAERRKAQQKVRETKVKIAKANKAGERRARLVKLRQKKAHFPQPNVPIKMPRAEVIGRIQLPKAA